MADIARDDDEIELAHPPRFAIGERVLSRSMVRNDGSYRGKDIGELLVQRGELGVVRSIGTFLQRYYIHEVEFVESGRRVGMRARELCTLDHLPPDVLAHLGQRLGGPLDERLAELRALG